MLGGVDLVLTNCGISAAYRSVLDSVLDDGCTMYNNTLRCTYSKRRIFLINKPLYNYTECFHVLSKSLTCRSHPCHHLIFGIEYPSAVQWVSTLHIFVCMYALPLLENNQERVLRSAWKVENFSCLCNTLVVVEAGF
jgi:hypothetical protein